MLLEVLVDPFVVFCAGCMVAPMLVDSSISQHDVIAYVSNPFIIGVLALMLLVVGATKAGRCVKLSFGDRMLARWYLLNGAIIHILMDGLVGVFKVDPYFAKHYGMLDARYAAPLGSFKGSAVHVVSLLELLVKGPICMVLYYVIHRGSPHRDALEFFTCVTQIYGTIVYLGQEAVSGAPHLDVDHHFEFTWHYIFYFWFAVIFGCLLYIVVPCIIALRVYRRLVGAREAPAKLKKK